MEFKNIGDLVNQVNTALGEFCNEFGRKRKELAGLGKVPKRDILFTYDTTKENDWAINEGGGTELQYHISFDAEDLEIKYGLGFNTQYVPFANQMSTIDYMQPYMYGYLKNKEQIKYLLPDYGFVDGNIEQLKSPKDKEYTLFGKVVIVEERADKYFIEDPVFNSIIEDLKKQFEPYQIIFKEKNNFKKSAMNIQNILDILSYKKQIILQGPPGTGKTRLAKEISNALIAKNFGGISTLTKEDILNELTINTEIKSVAGKAKYKILAIDNEKVTLSRESETTGDTKFSKIIDFYNNKKWEQELIDNDSRRAAALANYINEALLNKIGNSNTSQYLKLIQFHPAYSYEDFVRGIVAESKNEVIEYKTKNKLLAEFASKALANYKDSRKNTEQLTEDKWIENCFGEFLDFIADEIEKNTGRLLLEGTTTYLKEVEDDCFRYTGDNWNSSIGNRMHFKDILEMFNQKVKTRQDIKKMAGVSGLAKQHASYFMKVLDMFYTFMKNRMRPTTEVNQVKEKNFVLIIDEINRANLPAVLGELIYALEYRGETVESMYSIDDDNSLIIPPNLFIIGTMNTSDRSVGHIDYAIRRRFAFIDVLPKVLEGDNFELELFKQVSSLFIQNFDEYIQDNTVELKLSEHLSEEFRPEDVWLGHSYFMKNESDFALRKKYEIVPILKEYLKDGILKQSAESIINTL